MGRSAGRSASEELFSLVLRNKLVQLMITGAAPPTKVHRLNSTTEEDELFGTPMQPDSELTATDLTKESSPFVDSACSLQGQAELASKFLITTTSASGKDRWEQSKGSHSPSNDEEEEKLWICGDEQVAGSLEDLAEIDFSPSSQDKSSKRNCEELGIVESVNSSKDGRHSLLTLKSGVSDLRSLLDLDGIDASSLIDLSFCEHNYITDQFNSSSFPWMRGPSDDLQRWWTSETSINQSLKTDENNTTVIMKIQVNRFCCLTRGWGQGSVTVDGVPLTRSLDDTAGCIRRLFNRSTKLIVNVEDSRHISVLFPDEGNPHDRKIFVYDSAEDTTDAQFRFEFSKWLSNPENQVIIVSDQSDLVLLDKIKLACLDTLEAKVYSIALSLWVLSFVELLDSEDKVRVDSFKFYVINDGSVKTALTMLQNCLWGIWTVGAQVSTIGRAYARMLANFLAITQKALEQCGLWERFWTIECHYLAILIKQEVAGLPFEFDDDAALQPPECNMNEIREHIEEKKPLNTKQDLHKVVLAMELTESLLQWNASLYRKVPGSTFSFQNPEEVNRIITHEILGLPVDRSKRSYANLVREFGVDPRVQPFLGYVKEARRLHAALANMRLLLEQKEGRIYPSYTILASLTGRLSSKLFNVLCYERSCEFHSPFVLQKTDTKYCAGCSQRLECLSVLLNSRLLNQSGVCSRHRKDLLRVFDTKRPVHLDCLYITTNGIKRGKLLEISRRNRVAVVLDRQSENKLRASVDDISLFPLHDEAVICSSEKESDLYEAGPRHLIRIKDKTRILFAIDFNQIEFRILTHFSKDPLLTAIFRDAKKDPFIMVAAEWLKKEEKLVTEIDRTAAKRCVYQIIYGCGKETIQESLQELRRSALELNDADSDEGAGDGDAEIADFFSRFPATNIFVETLKRRIEQDGYVQTLFGRRRHFPALRDSKRLTEGLKSKILRQGVNTLCQGTAVDIVKYALCKAQKSLRSLNKKERVAQLITQIHDELIFEVQSSELENVKFSITECMNDISSDLSFQVPLTVKIATARRWAEICKQAGPPPLRD